MRKQKLLEQTFSYMAPIFHMASPYCEKKNSRKLSRLEHLGSCLIRYEIYYKSLAVRVMLATNAFELMAPGSYRKKYNLFVRFLNIVNWLEKGSKVTTSKCSIDFYNCLLLVG